MTRTLRYLLLVVLTGLVGAVHAQEIAGTVLDEKKEPLISAAVQVYQGGILKGGVVTDFDGKYSVKPLEPGYYDVLVLYSGYDSMMVTGVVVAGGQRTTQNFQLARPTLGKTLGPVTIIAYKKPLVDIDKSGTLIMTKEDLKVLPTTDIKDAVGLTPALYQSQRGKDVNIGGARTSGTLYVIDGVQVQGQNVATSQNGVDQLEVITSGIPAKYGDVSGGVVNITTRGVASKFNGNARIQHSVDGYNNNMASISIAGPLYKKRIDSVTKKPVLGFSLSGDVYDDNNRYPAYNDQYVIKRDVRDRVIANPLRISSDNNGNQTYNYESNYLTKNDLEQVRIVPHASTQEVRLNGKLDYQISDNMRIAAGGNGNWVKQDLFDRQRSVLNAEGTPSRITLTGRAFLRFTQKFGKPNDTVKNVVSNAYYTVQGDYQRTSEVTQDANFKTNIFNYGYIGKFIPQRAPIYNFNSLDSALSLPVSEGGLGHEVRATILTGERVTGISYERDNMNPSLANYTSQYYGSRGDNLPTSLPQIQGNALVNGDQPRSVYSANGIGLLYNTGSTMNYYRKYSSDQYALSVDASFDLLLGNTKHAIEFGLYYQQRVIRQFTAYSNLGFVNGGTSSLWQLMRGLVSSPENNNLRFDKSNPIVRANGKEYTKDQILQGKYIPGPTDTIVYNYMNVGTSTFDKKLREKLGKKSNDIINVDEVRPDQLSLDMFSADELLNISGSNFVEYNGFGYTGSTQTGAVNFNDFWTKKDKDGNFTRPIAPFTPNYIAGYVLDKFDYKDMHFNVGLRIDRYSANTKVLKDPYSLYEEKNLSQVAGTNNLINGGKHPDNMGSDYVVYVSDNNAATPAIVGYRNGNNWYDPTGRLVEDPEVLKAYTGGRAPQPYLVDPKTRMFDSSFNPNSSFTDYNPSVNLQPRLQFSFPISDVANFYAHYDIYTQRPYPTGVGQATAWTYYELATKAPNVEIPNANIQPEKTFDYEVGFQQKLNDHSALTITGFYKERKNQISLFRYINAYPFGYMTYGNRDFSTTKGATMLYDLRPTNHLAMTVAYTLQFAEGTGSTYNGGKGLLEYVHRRRFA
jgi:hypothetical protein